MSPLIFLSYNIVLLVICGLTTFTVGLGESVRIPVAGLVGVALALMVIQISRKLLVSKGFGLLAASISSTVVLLNYGLFFLILLRNPMLQWPAVFLVTSIAALFLGGFGYRRGLRKIDKAP